MSMLSRNIEASSSSASVKKWTYDVFVSCRGEDTGKNFTDHLYSRLDGAGITMFRDKNELKRGEKISSQLFEAIHGSKIFLVVFSQNYATSRWCLDELVEIMKCKNQLSQLVLPIFYKVNPSDVRRQSGSFGEAFVKHDDDPKVEKNKVSSWRAALAEAGELSGWDLDATDGREGEFLKKIIERILSELNHTHLHVTTHPVGIDTRMEYIISQLSVETRDVRTVGICGMGGIGKTTLAKAVFNHLFHRFESKSFLANVKENSNQHEKQILLQEQLLSDIILKSEVKVGNVDRGIMVIKGRLCNKRVLVVLDDVDQLEQLIAFHCHSDSARKDCFGPGSRIIITTRNLHLLERIEVNSNYMVKELNAEESLKLFSLHAFERSDPLEGHAQLSKDVVSYCKGLPLALEVLGSCLREFKSTVEWKNTLDKLRNNPHDKIQEKLKISFDALDDYEKKIFLDIACFFIGMDEHYVKIILDGCGFYATNGIGVLTRRCLLTIDKGKLMMHDLLRDMGREIVREKSVECPGQRSRLWHWEDALDVLTNRTGTVQIEGLALNMDGRNKVVLSTEAFAGMHNLRLLQLNNVNITGGYEHLSKNLRWLCWHRFALNSLPSNFNQEKLIAIDMQHSNLRQFWKNKKVFENLKILNLSHSHFLTSITTDFSTLPNLEKMILNDCRSLKTIDESIGSLDKLCSLNLIDCANLRDLPRSVCMLKSLKFLRLSGCLKFEKLPEKIGQIKSLVTLSASRTAIRQVPISMKRLKNLRYLSLCGSTGSPSTSLLLNSLLQLTSLTRLHLDNISAVPNNFGSLSSLKHLDLADSNFDSLPASIKILCKLKTLLLKHCRNLRSLPELPSSLTILRAFDSSLERLPDLSNFSHPPLMLVRNCSKLVEFPCTENVLQRWYGRYGGTKMDDILFSYSEIPDWFSSHRTGNVLSIQVAQDMSMMKGFVLCVIYAAHDFKIGTTIATEYIVYVTNLTKGFCHTCIRLHIYDEYASPNEHLSLGYVPIEEFKVDSGDEVEIKIDTGCELIVNKCGVIPVYIEAKKRTKMDTEEEVNEFNSSSGNDGVIIVHDQGHLCEGHKGKRKRYHSDDEDDEAGLSHAGEKGKRKCNDDEEGEAGTSHYWSYEEHTLSTHEMVVVPRDTHRRRFQCIGEVLGDLSVLEKLW